ncbi:MAG: F0F1 ATP synthase subunit delta [Candidatus Pacebacteria bacterium]|nr:F0F1 ATP synthase subunit delta [Candidatus Paceibacterota bacterium]
MYAEAYYRAAADKSVAVQETLAAKLRTLLVARGHAQLLPRILKELECIIRRRSSTAGAVVCVAHTSDFEVYKESIERDLQTLGASSLALDVRTDVAMIGGYDLRANGQRIQRTYKRALLDLYGTLIT